MPALTLTQKVSFEVPFCTQAKTGLAEAGGHLLAGFPL